jgi:hypothetical protein
MTERERLATTFGILLAGLIRAEEEATESERNPVTTSESGVYPLGQAAAEVLIDEAIDHVAAESARAEV